MQQYVIINQLMVYCITKEEEENLSKLHSFFFLPFTVSNPELYLNQESKGGAYNIHTTLLRKRRPPNYGTYIYELIYF